MGGSAPVPGGSRRRSLDAAINLVPFIDLLSCCLSFLLITAVWTQLGRLDVAREPGGATAEYHDEVPDPILLDVTPAGLWLRASGDVTELLARDGDGDYDYARLRGALETVAAAATTATPLSIRAHDAVRYERLIHLIDVAHGARFPDVGLVELPPEG
jgi:biopolymer transport protein ExbD